VSLRLAAQCRCVPVNSDVRRHGLSTVTAHRDELLRRVGRNVVNFQRLEASLRALIPALAISGTLREIEARQDRLRRMLKKASLGDLASEFEKHAYSESQGGSEMEEVTEPSFSFSLRIESEGDVSSRKRSLLRLVSERNRLIHRDLVDVNLDSPDQCIRLSEQLDSQNERIRTELSMLENMRLAHREGMEELLRYVESGEFLRDLQSGRNDV
jgi:hypothetical protein